MFSRKKDAETEHYDKAVEFYNRTQYPDALREINLALDINREAGAYYYLKGQVLEFMEKIEEAMSAYTYASMYDPRNKRLYDPQVERLRPIVTEKQGMPMKYLGGHSGFIKSDDVHLRFTDNAIEIPEFSLNIPYEKITMIKTQTKTDLAKLAGTAIVVGVFAALGDYTHYYMLMNYIDEIQMEQTMVFDGNVIEIQPKIYRKVVEAKTRK